MKFFFVCIVMVSCVLFSTSCKAADISQEILMSGELIDSNIIENKSISFVDAERIDSVYYYKFKLGYLENSFVTTLGHTIKNTGGLKLTYESSISTIETVSKSITNRFETSVSSSTSAEIKIESSTDVKVFKAGGSLAFLTSESTTTANDYAVTTTNIVEMVETEISTIELDLDLYKKDYYYALGMFADVMGYQMIEYNKKTNLINSYFMCDINNATVKVISSPNNNLQQNSNYKLEGYSAVSSKFLEQFPISNETSNSLTLLDSEVVRSKRLVVNPLSNAFEDLGDVVSLGYSFKELFEKDLNVLKVGIKIIVEGDFLYEEPEVEISTGSSFAKKYKFKYNNGKKTIYYINFDVLINVSSDDSLIFNYMPGIGQWFLHYVEVTAIATY